VEEIVPPLRARGARLIAVSDVRAVLRRAQTRLPLTSCVPEWLSPLTAVVPGQVAAMRLTLLRNRDLDRPSGLRKVTLTR
jgi:glucosamine--fructose-6-phosphate aminotransferase (isomerizing)